ncbi:MAG: hypothetical protein ACD_76C00044G0032 [uncultured bacterium]|nr:MAG: hypothetical protein ACD_76C00044G0032 [uncultured bacterium]HBD05206.1 septum formation protein Maf [Candidatus Uhrbacteria bacterium]
MKRIILASGSPRKKEILSKLGLPFEVIPSSYEEDMTAKSDQYELAKFLSLGKARDVAKQIDGAAIVIGADTFVSFDGKFLGKPKNENEARIMLEQLSGKTHEIITGVTLIDTSTCTEINEALVSKIMLRLISPDEIDGYIKTGEPLDKAGAYAIQERGAAFVERINGDFYTVMGLPLFFVAQKLKELGVKLF